MPPSPCSSPARCPCQVPRRSCQDPRFFRSSPLRREIVITKGHQPHARPLPPLRLASGSRHTYRDQGVAEKINLQGVGGDANPYQVKQVRRVILKYRLGI